MFRTWAEKVRPAWDPERSGKPVPSHRKLWEWCYIAQVLWERGLLQPGRPGLGFGVGHEPLAALFASFKLASSYRRSSSLSKFLETVSE
jgi:hypothetical protein